MDTKAQGQETTFPNPHSGSIVFGLEWPSDVPRSAQALNNPDIDCDAVGVANIFVVVSESSGTRLGDGSFACSRGEGAVNNIASGSERTVSVYGKDVNGTNLYSGEQTGIAISPGVTTDIGTVLLEVINPDADTDVYWSSTNVSYNTGYAWAIGFFDGDDFNRSKSVSYYVRAVRGGQ